MYSPLSALWAPALRTTGSLFTGVTHYDRFTRTTTELMVIDGVVTPTSDPSTVIRRTLSLSVPPTEALFEALAAPGGEVTVTQSIRYIDQTTETVPLGVFIVDQDTIGYRPDAVLALTCRDRGVKVQRNRFRSGSKASVPTNMVWQEIQRLVEGAWPDAGYPFPGWAQLDQTATARVGSQKWTDREKAITDLAKANSLQFFFDQSGRAVLRKTPVLTSSSQADWIVNYGDQGVMVTADRTRDRTRTHNAVEANTSAQGLILPTQFAANTDPTDPLNIYGPLGYVPDYLTLATFTTAPQMLAAAKTALAKQLGLAQQIDLEAASNPALDADDVVAVVLPPIDRDGEPGYELHIVDSCTIPLLHTTTQTIQTRSTRPADDSEA